MTLSFTASSTSGIECRVQRYDFFMKLKKIMKEKCKNRPKRHKKAPIPSATYRPAIGQLPASYRPATKKQRMQMCPFCVSHEQSGPLPAKEAGLHF